VSPQYVVANHKLTRKVFNNTLYILLAASFVLRMIALSHHNLTPERSHYNVLSYDFLAFSAPFFWLRVLLYLDTYRFFGVCSLCYHPRVVTNIRLGNARRSQSDDE